MAILPTDRQIAGSDTEIAGPIYDAAGNVVQDAIDNYLYDAKGRLCAVENLLTTSATGYVYDAEGNRVAKGNWTGISWPTAGNAWAANAVPNCSTPTAANGFTLTAVYLRGSGGQDVEIDPAQGANPAGWRQNVFAGGGLLATYTQSGAASPALYFNFNDWLGTKRLEVNAAGQAVNYWGSDPFGDYLSPHVTQNDATEIHLTAKERDTESGLDYFGARYYASTMGRFMSPDPTQLYYADPMNPQSLNLYGFVLNNPLVNVDPNGMDCIHINVDTGKYEGFESGDCDNSTEEKANSGQYIDGTVTSITTTTGDTSGVVTGYSGTSSDDPSTLISGTFATPLQPQIDPDDARINAFVQGVAADTKDLTNLMNTSAYCVADNYGLTMLAGGTALAGAPVAKSALGVGNGLGGNASPYTSGLGAAAFKAFGANEPKFSGALGKLSKSLTGTARVAGAGGRIAQKAAPALAAVNAALIVRCIAAHAK